MIFIGLGDTIFKLQITSLGILILVAIYCICFFSCARCIDDDDDEGSCVKSLNVAIFLYLVTGKTFFNAFEIMKKKNTTSISKYSKNRNELQIPIKKRS